MDQGPQRGPYIRHPSIIIVIPGVYTRFLPSFLPSFLSFFLSWLPSPLPSSLLARRFRKKARHVSTDAHLSLPTCLFRRENKRERKRESFEREGVGLLRKVGSGWLLSVECF